MKLLFKSLLILAVVLGIFYASSPWWLPTILAKQLPPEWQLESLNMSWPGVSGVNLKHAKVRGKFPGLSLTVEAENSRLSYRGLATIVDSVVLHVYLPSSESKPPEPLSIDDLSLPRFHLSASLPSLTVNQAQLALHLASDNPASDAGLPIVIALQGFKLDPADQGRYRLDTIATIVGQQTINGQINVDVSPEKLSAQVRFPADKALPEWLNLTFIQVADFGVADPGVDDPEIDDAEVNNQGTSESELNLHFDADATSDQWLDALLNKSTDGRLTHVSGQLQAHAVFNGDQVHHLSQMSLTARDFEVVFDGDTAVIDSDIRAKREAQVILVEFSDTGDSGAGQITLLDRNGRIESVIANLIPELNRSTGAAPERTPSLEPVHSNPANSKLASSAPVNSDPANMNPTPTEPVTAKLPEAKLTITPASQLRLNLPESALAKPSLSFMGGLALDYKTDNSNIQLNLGDLNIGIADLEQMGQFDLAAGLSMSWKEQGPFSYSSDTLSLTAKSLLLKASGKLSMAPELSSFQPTGRVDAALPGLRAKIQTGEPSAPGWIEFIAENLQATQAQLGFDLIGPAENTETRYSFRGPLHAINPKITIFSSAKPPETVVTASELSLTATLTSDANQLKSSGNGYLSHAKAMPMAANVSRIDLKWTELDLSQLTGALDAKTEGLNIMIDEQSWTGFNLNTSLKLLKDDNIKGSGTVSFGSGSDLPIEFSGNTGSNWWDVNLLNSTVPLAGLRAVLRSAHIELPAELKLAGGSIDVAGVIQIHDEISAQMDLSGSEIAADLVESHARQASFQFKSGYVQDVFATGPVAIQHLELAGGVDIADINADIKLENSQTFGFSKLNANLFDGQLKIDQFHYADSSIEDTTISLTHISLQKLLLYLDMDGLEGSGFIDFSLPTGSHGEAIHIKDGTFASTGPGRLAYSKGNMASTNIGLKALDNFHYTSLSGKIAYESTGPYQITIRLEGSNPDLYSGYPVIFNLTINGSLPALFEAMFLTGSFEEAILKQIKMK